MPADVDRLSERRYSLAHDYEQNGDMVPDPEGEFVKTDAGWLPVALQLCTDHYTRAVELDARDLPVGVNPRALADLMPFARMRLRNVDEQQALKSTAQRSRGRRGYYR